MVVGEPKVAWVTMAITKKREAEAERAAPGPAPVNASVPDLANVADPAHAIGPDDLVATEKIAKIGEHTSELQSHDDLVCRLLLEKKKKIKQKKKKKKKKNKKKKNKNKDETYK